MVGLMDVVATRKGKYGTLRDRGDTFTLAQKSDFSERWMVKAKSAAAKAILAEQGAAPSTAAQIAAEEAAAAGDVRAAYKAELAEKDQRIADLEAEIERLAAGKPDGTPDDDPDGTPDDDPDGPPDDAPDSAPAASPRRTRRSRG